MLNRKQNQPAPISQLRKSPRPSILKPQLQANANMNNVYSMLDKQQENINSLLSKYMDEDPGAAYHGKYGRQGFKDVSGREEFEGYIKSRTQTIDQINSQPMSSLKLKLMLSKDQKPLTRQSSPNSLLRQSDQYILSHRNRHGSLNTQHSKNESISLPIIYQKGTLQKSRRKKSRNKSQINSLKDQFSSNFRKDKQRMEHQLYRIYGEKNFYFANDHKSQVKSSLASSRPKKSKRKQKNVTPIQSLQNSIQTEQKQLIKSNKANNEVLIESDDQSNTDQVATMYYERQFRDLMRGQCLEQLNFLYFSKNQQMKDWTDTLLSMIEKHDKQVTAVRKKSKYLYNFDDKFFSIGIFNTNDV